MDDREMDKGETISYRLFLAFAIVLFIFFVIDLCLSCINTCQVLGGGYQCGLKHVIDLIPTL